MNNLEYSYYKDLLPSTFSTFFTSPEYDDLYRRHSKRLQSLLELDDELDMPAEKFFEHVRVIESLYENDIDHTLSNEQQKREYRLYSKLRTVIETEDLDEGLLPYLIRFNCLPFESHESCTGHINRYSNTIEEDTTYLLVFTADKGCTREEQILQYQFLQGIERLNSQLAGTFSINSPLHLVGELKESLEDISHVGWEQSWEEDGPFYLILQIEEDDRSRLHGTDVLSSVWEELWKYMQTFDGVPIPYPSFTHTQFMRPAA